MFSIGRLLLTTAFRSRFDIFIANILRILHRDFPNNFEQVITCWGKKTIKFINQDTRKMCELSLKLKIKTQDEC